MLVVPPGASSLELVALAMLARGFRAAAPANRQERIDGTHQ
jgi:hypothetical protein